MHPFQAMNVQVPGNFIRFIATYTQTMRAISLRQSMVAAQWMPIWWKSMMVMKGTSYPIGCKYPVPSHCILDELTKL